jgi:hypothetical protein
VQAQDNDFGLFKGVILFIGNLVKISLYMNIDVDESCTEFLDSSWQVII